ncbi:5-hydroxytryptamine (serotonin) receptor 1A isoform 1-T3 [Cochliomyia hominivorax]
MARKTSFDDALDYIFIANDKNPNTYVISSAAGSYTSATTTSATGQYDTSSRIVNAISGTAALTAATVTATTAIFGSINNSNNFASDSLLPAGGGSSPTPSTLSLTASVSSSPLSSSSDSSMFSNVAVDLGSLLINDSMLNDTSLLADLVNISDPFSNASASGNMTTPEDLGELIRMAATSIVLGLMILITIIGNVFVIAAIILERNLQNVANYLVASLAVADLFVACLVMPLGAVYEISQGWILGPELCDIWTSIDVLCCTASILHLVAIAVDRYWAVTNIDYIHSRTSRRVFLMIFFVWTAAVIVSLAPQFGWKDPDYLQRIEQQKCMVSQDIAYQIFATCCTFYVPLLVILFLYWKIYQTARKRIHRRRPKPINVTGNNNQPDLTTQKKRKRLRLRIGKFSNDKTNMGTTTTLGLVEGNSTNTVNTVEVEDTEFSSSNMDSKSRAGNEVTNINLNNTEEVPSTSANNQQIATVSHLVALAHQTHQTLSKTSQTTAGSSESVAAATTTTTTKTLKLTKSCLTQPVQVQENPLEPFKSTTNAISSSSSSAPPSCLATTTTEAAATTNEIPAITSTANGIAVNNNNNNNNNHHHLHNNNHHQSTLEVLEDPQLQQQLEQVQQQTQTNVAQTPTTPAAAAIGVNATTTTTTPATTTSILHKTQGASTSNATTITSISALSPQTPTVTTPSSNPLPHSSHTPNPPSAYASSQVTPVPRAKHPQQQLSSIANPMHKVTKRKETLEAKRERKAAKTLAIITGAFVVCWLPFFAMALLLPLCESCEINDAVASFFLWLGYFNSTLNPVIYTIFSPEFRQAFKRILFGGHRPVHYRSGKL